MAAQELHLGDYQARVDYALGAMDEQAFSRRFWEKDPSLWKQGPDGEKVILNRLGWLGVVPTMIERVPEILRLVEEVRADNFTHAVLMGMGGSSLSPEVSRLTFGVKEGYLDLMVLDSTIPSAVADIERRIDPAKTLFIVSTKSGTTVETLSAYEYFYQSLSNLIGDRAGKNFIAITDPGTPLEEEAGKRGFRKTFINFPDIGGRYSALSYFGLVPAALIGVDINELMNRANSMAEACGPDVQPSENPAMILGAVMAELAMEGRNKLTLIMPQEIGSFGCWIEQLVAESTGKSGTGVLPVEGEFLTDPANYGDDRLFVYTRLASFANTELDEKVDTLIASGQPVLCIYLDDLYDLGAEYFRWEMATGVASALLGVNAFDEPNVKESKDNTNRLLSQFKAEGHLPQDEPVIEESGILLYCDEETKSVLDKIRTKGPYRDESLLSYIAAHLDQFQPGNYFALMAFIKPSEEIDGIFQCMRGHLRDAYSAATTLGYGPRFLHSTGQFHKGGPNTGMFIQFTADDSEDVPVPGQLYSFSILKQAQAMGDALSLRSKGCRLIRIHLGADIERVLNYVLDLVHQAVSEQPE